ncbi:double-strand-break repair protein rad21-like protein 1 isoform X3 [Gallus gallus]|uniref:double-strand-break repair protein rad21-like protein 1 isoform X3 n=1 Tax=Gallus gallus TaxID=9031 RepID=UPI001F00E9F8|nr:double-strand-break repair protein rad21-like protein 1 isoform X3 [Gallus gallus]
MLAAALNLQPQILPRPGGVAASPRKGEEGWRRPSQPLPEQEHSEERQPRCCQLQPTAPALSGAPAHRNSPQDLLTLRQPKGGGGQSAGRGVAGGPADPHTMFYMHLLVNRRGPLAKIWLAAHWEKKLTKAHIFECNLETTIKKIVSPKFTIALRTSGHLLLGVVRIYHRKTKYLLSDCSEALTKMKTAFRPGLVDLPEESCEAAYQSITLPEEFHDFETTLPDLNAIDVAEHFTLNQSRAEDITLKEDYESNVLLCDRNFDEESDALRKQSFFDVSVLMSSCNLVADHSSASVSGDKPALHESSYCLEQDCFGDEEAGADMIEILLRDEQNGLTNGILDMEEELPMSQDLQENSTDAEFNHADTAVKTESHLMNETMLLPKEEGFVLEPVDDTDFNQRKNNKRKRKLLVDADKELSLSAIYHQLNNSVGTLVTLDLAPPTKQIMMWKESGGVETLLSQPAQHLFHAELQTFFAKCFKRGRFAMGRNVTQMESEVEKTRKEQDATEVLITDESSYLQELDCSEAERKTDNDLFALTARNSSNETVNGFGGTLQDEAAFSESSMLLNNSMGREAPVQHAEITHELEMENRDNEEIKWSKRTLQLLKTLQHLNKSGVNSFSLRELCRKNSRKEVAVKFYIFLVLQKQMVVELVQCAPFADVTATAGRMFSAH